jgi:hypothetical protein
MSDTCQHGISGECDDCNARYGEQVEITQEAFDAVMWGWLTPAHVAIAQREARTGIVESDPY